MKTLSLIFLLLFSFNTKAAEFMEGYKLSKTESAYGCMDSSQSEKDIKYAELGDTISRALGEPIAVYEFICVMSDRGKKWEDISYDSRVPGGFVAYNRSYPNANNLRHIEGKEHAISLAKQIYSSLRSTLLLKSKLRLAKKDLTPILSREHLHTNNLVALIQRFGLSVDDILIAPDGLSSNSEENLKAIYRVIEKGRIKEVPALANELLKRLKTLFANDKLESLNLKIENIPATKSEYQILDSLISLISYSSLNHYIVFDYFDPYNKEFILFYE